MKILTVTSLNKIYGLKLTKPTPSEADTAKTSVILSANRWLGLSTREDCSDLPLKIFAAITPLGRMALTLVTSFWALQPNQMKEMIMAQFTYLPQVS